MKKIRTKSIKSTGETTTVSVKHLIKQRGGSGGGNDGDSADMEVSKSVDETSLFTDMNEPSIDADKISYDVFIYEDPKIKIPRNFDAVSKSIKNQRRKVCILSIDGGGMRGILPGKALAYLENALKLKSGYANAQIADYFDVAAGSEIGGLFTAMLFATRDGNRPIFKADDTWQFLKNNAKDLYRSKGDRPIFKVNDTWQSLKNLYGVIKRVMRTGSDSTGSGCSGSVKIHNLMKHLFSDLTLKNTLKPVLIPTYDFKTSGPFTFSRADALKSDAYDFCLYDICKATWSESGVFNPVMINSVNKQTSVAIGVGLAMSNPTTVAITHVLNNKHEFPHVRGVEDLIVVSLGVGGLIDVKYEYDEIIKWTAKEWAQSAVLICNDGVSDTVDQAVAMAFGQCHSSNYIRIQV